ncbi:MAG: right-handed parallel beta-helix repeat-containing protein [Archaeoglobus sp.]|uniref:right-handed parallel beta-helix repeat-containing protein n=1 Tax=Archaeoglobus sp. TaxID=1872626 RepID=UPI001D838682|nr:right-handed parallel beta-helix repeat-containing protein [Archaeoglobus sp.]MBO8179112.1 right-handed parallel beta-helix repeat-containing protein [Archaeoglobus sp.]
MKEVRLIAVAVALVLISNLAGSLENDVSGNKTISVGQVYFPGEKVVVWSSFVPEVAKLVDPSGKVHELKFEEKDSGFEAEFELKKDIVLGEYLVFVDNITAEFYVDSYSISADYRDGAIVGNVSYFFIEPKYVEYEIKPDGRKGSVEVINGSFTIPVGFGEYEVLLKCGNAGHKLNISPKLELNVEVEAANNTSVVWGLITVDGKNVRGNLSYWFDGEEKKEIRVNGSFELVLNKTGKLHLRAEVGSLIVEKVLKIGKEKREVEVGEVYYPGDVVVIKTNFKLKKAFVLSPADVKYKLEFENYTAKFELKKDVVLGNYTVVVDGVVKRFTVDFCELNAKTNGSVIEGEASCFFSKPFVEYQIVTEDEKFEGVAEVINGTFEVKLPEKAGEVFIRCGNAEVTLKISHKEVFVEELYFINDTVEVKANFMPLEAYIITPSNRTVELNFSKKGELYVAEILAEEVGKYELHVDELNKSFFVDDYSINVSFNGSAVVGEVKWHFVKPEFVFYTAGKETGKVEVDDEGRFVIPVKHISSKAEKIEIECGNAKFSLEIVMERTLIAKDLYFIGEEVVVKANFEPANAYIIFENNTTPIIFERSEKDWVYSFKAERVGKYEVYADNVSVSFYVDDYQIEAELNGSFVEGKVSWHFVEPEFVNYTFEPSKISGVAELTNGSFRIEIPGNSEFVLIECGNAEFKLNLTVGLRDFYFINETVVLDVGFEPKVAFIRLGNETFDLTFEDGKATFKPEKVGIYELVLDNSTFSFIVDSYKLRAEAVGSEVVGEVEWNFVKPEFVEYVLLPMNLSGNVDVINGSFVIPIPENVTSVRLRCGNAELELSWKIVSDKRVVEFEGMKFNVSLDKGKFDELKFDGENVSIVIANLKVGEKVNVTVELPFEIPEGMHIYYWKEFDGKFIPVNYTAHGREITFTLQDGVVDEDGKADGVIVDPIKFYIPRFKVERELNGKSGKLHVFDLNGTKLYDVKVEVSKGNLSYLAFVDSENLPERPAEFPYQLVKFRVEGLEAGEEVEVKIAYPNLEGALTDNGVKYYKFNPESLNWSNFYAMAENSTVILKLRDGGYGDEDGKENGVLVDDGGIGWAGFTGEWSASICRDGKTNEVHTYWVYVPYGDRFTISVYDGDDGFVYNRRTYHFWLDVYYPNGGTFYNSFNATSSDAWDYFNINTNNQFGWWRVEVHADDWSGYNGNYYGLNITGSDAINIKVNESWNIGGETFYGTPDAIILEYDNSGISNTREFWVYADNDFEIAIFDPDSNVATLEVTYPDGTTLLFAPAGNNRWWTQSIDVFDAGWFRILLNQTNNFDDYSTGNFMRVAVNLSGGLFFKPVVNIKGRVLEDFYPLGVNNGEDVGVSNVRVALFEDRNGNGQIDFSDKIRQISYTDSNGNYIFTITRNVDNFIVAVDSKTVSSTRGLNPGYTQSQTWAEQTYQTEWDGSNWVVVKKFGGQNPEISDNFGLNFEHYTGVNLSHYNGESIDFGFSFDVVVNTKDENAATLKPIGEVFIVNDVGSSWKKVYLHNYYENPVIVCTYNLPSSSDPSAVVRLRNVDHYSFEIRIQNPGDSMSPTPSDVHCIVMEEGSWTLEDERKVEAHRVLSGGTNRLGNWQSSLMEQISYNWSYTNPVVLGQVMSYNDSRWSVFWTCNGNKNNPPDSSNLYVGKHIGEDIDTTRNPELLGVIVVEQGSGVVNGMSYEAKLGDDSIRGVDNGPPYTYTLTGDYSISIATQNAMDGGNGGWAVLYGSNPVSNVIQLAIDEDQISDDERRHTHEQVAYWVFNKSGVLTARIDSERACQGCLRQFILNSNAILGKQRSYFVMAVNPNSQDSSGSWWSIQLNSELPTITDSVELSGTVLNPDMTIRDSNPGYVIYNYSTQSLESTASQKTIPVGVGKDGIPFSGDEEVLEAIPKPEVEIYGSGIAEIINVTADNVEISGLALFGSSSNGIKIGEAERIYGNNAKLSHVFVGSRANGTDPAESGLSRNAGIGMVVYSNNTSIHNSIFAFNGGTGLYFWGGGVDYGKVDEVIAYRNGLQSSNADGSAVEGYLTDGYDQRASNVSFNKCLASNNAAMGIDTWYGDEGLSVNNSTFEYNGIGNEAGQITETGGIRILTNESFVFYNLIRENNGPGVVIGRMSEYSVRGVLVRFNSIYNNDRIGIDIDERLNNPGTYTGDNVTQNDGQIDCSQPNCGIDYPVITSAVLNDDTLHLTGFVGPDNVGGDPSFANAIVDVYLVKNSNRGDNLNGNNVSSDGSVLSDFYGEGWIYLGSLSTDASGSFAGNLDVSGKGVEIGSLISAVTNLNNNISEFGPDTTVSMKSINAEATLNVNINSVNISVKARGDLNDIKVYWIKPDNLSITSMTGDFDANGTSGNVYWWEFSSIAAGETKYVDLAVRPTGDYSMLRAFNIGIDPR